ncbi:GMP/IMP nucleotidase [Shewanella maritima]|uniref:GMP/IMP nucleotidase n=1 Tax=Shewanella maritima TaxID=2520507 RepID=UPI0037367A99
MFPWHQIDTVLLDMDGTLLDLHFDNHFWLQLVPEQLSHQQGISHQQASQMVTAAYHKVVGTLEWYCFDYWEQQLGLDLLTLHYSIVERIQMRQDSMPFLQALAYANKRRILLTNAHPKSLALKLEHTELAMGLDEKLSSHESGYPKEHPEFWRYAFEKYQLDPTRCLFIDDSPAILAASKLAGVEYQLAITNPDSQKPHNVISDFPAIDDYRQLLQDLKTPYTN